VREGKELVDPLKSWAYRAGKVAECVAQCHGGDVGKFLEDFGTRFETSREFLSWQSVGGDGIASGRNPPSNFYALTSDMMRLSYLGRYLWPRRMLYHGYLVHPVHQKDIFILPSKKKGKEAGPSGF
jgi:hypothetical protein